MKSKLSSLLTLTSAIAILCSYTGWAMPPHPDLIKKITDQAVRTPFALAHRQEILERGLDNPDSVSPLQNFIRNHSLDEDFAAIVILIDFSDHTSQTSAGSFNTLLYGDQTGSLKSYLSQISYGNITLVTLNLPSALGWRRMPQTYSYYCNGANGEGTYPQNAQKMVEDAIALVNPVVNFANYDNDGDGYVDALFVIHSGPGAEYTGSDNDIWSHQWATRTPQSVDGVYAYYYSTEPEYWQTSGDMTCGVYAHEMGHAAFGLPDLYDYGYDSKGLGKWSLMAGGSWNGTLGNSPAHPDAWSKIQMGVLSPTLVTSSLIGASIPNVETNPVAYKIYPNGITSQQYVLVENRQASGYDATLPGNGLLIYHIDESVGNNNSQWYPGYTANGHYKVALEQADGLWQLEHNSSSGNTGDPYPGSSTNRTYNDTSTPDSKNYNSGSTGIAVQTISNSSSTMTADLYASIGTPLTVSSPNGGETWALGQVQTIRWARGSASGPVTVQLNRSFPSGTWETLNSNVSVDTLSYAPTGSATTTARVRVVLNSDGSIGDTSNSDFTIANSQIVLTAPVGGETWSTGSTATITWTRTNATGNVTVQIDRNYPSGSWTNLTTSASTSSYAWTVTGPTTSAARIRIFLTSSSGIGDTCGSNVSIVVPTLSLDSPVGGETWITGSTANITWTRTNAIGNVTVQIDRNYPSGSWTNLTTSASSSSYAWTVTGPATSAARIRIFLTSSTGIGDTSGSNLSIVIPSISLSSPNGGESWLTGSQQTIRWTRSNAVGNAAVLLKRSYPNGTWETLSSTATADSINWTVTGASTTSARVRVYLISNSTAADTSAVNFSIVQPAITVQSPNGGESWAVNQAQTVRWVRGSASGPVTVQLNRSYPSGTWETLNSSVTVDTLSYTPTGSITTTARIRVLLNSDGSIGDTSNSNFSIINPQIVLTAPNGGETWVSGNTQSITWTRSGASGAATILLNRNYPSGAWETLSSSETGTSYSWLVTTPVTSAARVRIFLNSNTAIADTSNSNFEIVVPSVTLTDPVGGEVWTTGSSVNIAWTRSNATGNVTVQFNRNYPSGTWESLTTTASGNSYAWTVTSPATITGRVRIFLTSSSSVGDTCSSNLTIVIPTLTLNAPNGGETWIIGSMQTIRWSRSYTSGSVSVQLNRTYPTGTWEVLTSSSSLDSLAWIVSGNVTSSARMRIFLVSNENVADTSASNFNIVRTSLALQSPNGGETWIMDQPQMIRWIRNEASGGVTVQINRSYPGSSWEVIHSNVTSDSVSYTPSGAGSTTTRLRLFLNSNPSVGDTSNSNFTLAKPQITLTSPNGGESWMIGSTQTITWTRYYASGAATVMLNRNYPTGTWETLTSTDTASTFIWSITGDVSSNARIKLFLNSHPSLGDTSNANFSLVIPSLLLTSPLGGETWITGNSVNITWNRVNAAGNVTVQLNRSFPSGVWTTLTSGAASSSFTWTVTAPLTSTARIRIFLTADSLTSDSSDSNFNITIPSLTLTSPNGGENWALGSSQVIRWVRNGLAGGVAVQLNRSYPAGTWESLASSVTVDSLTWTVSGAITSLARIRIYLVSNSALGDTSNANISITGSSMTVLSPNGGESWIIGQPQQISWIRSSAAGAVTVQLNRSYPSGSWQTISTNVLGDSISFTPTGTATSTARFRVYLNSNPSVGDTSNAGVSFVIATLTLQTPNGGESFTMGTEMPIRWTRTNAPGNVNILLDRNYSSGAWETLATTSVDSFVWTTSGTASAACRIKVELASATSVSDISYSSFSLVQRNIRITTPNGGETLYIGTSNTITITRTNASGNATLQMDRNYPSGVWETLTSNLTVNDYNWNVLGPISSSARFRVFLTSDTAVGDTSDANCAVINPIITLDSPNGGEQWLIGSTHVISWTRNHVNGAVSILLDRNYPSGTWETITNSEMTSSYTWIVSGPAATNARIRILQNTNADVCDTSVASFSVVIPTLSIVAPNGGETYIIGRSMTIRWTRLFASGDVSVFVNRSYPASSWETLTTSANADSFVWAISGAASSTCRIIIRLTADPSVSDMSSADFSIISKSVSIAAPNGGETLYVGSVSSVNIARTNAPENITLQLDRNYPSGIWEPLTATLSGSSYLWTVSGLPTMNARIRAFLTDEPYIGDTSNASFTILDPSIELTYPVGGELWLVGSNQTIAWQRYGTSDNVHLEINRSYPSGSWEQIATSLSGTTYAWTVTSPLTSNARLRVIPAVNSSLGDTCAANFSIIQPSLTLLYPNGNDTLAVGNTASLRWSRNNAPGGVRVELNRAYPSGAWETLASSINADTLVWAVSGPSTTTARFRVTLVANSSITDISDLNSAIIIPAIQFITPEQGDTILIGSSVSFTWTRTANNHNVDIYIKRNWPSGLWNLIGSNLSGNSWNWTASGSSSDNARFKIQSTLNPSLGDTTDGAIVIGLSQLVITTPSSAQTYRIGEQIPINWSRSFASGNARIELSRQGTGGPWEELGTTSENSWLWTVTGSTSNAVRFRVSLISQPGVSVMTAFNSSIVSPLLVVTSPLSGQKLTIGRDVAISWTRANVPEPLNVYIDRNGTGTDLELVRQNISADSIHWIVTGPSSSTCRFVVRTSSGLIVTGVAAWTVEIGAPNLTLVYPVGGETFLEGQTIRLQWSRSFISDPVQVRFNRNYPVESWVTLAASVTDTIYNWTVHGTTHQSCSLLHCFPD